MSDPEARPEFIKTNMNIDDYNVVFVGFPIWWYTAPRIINTFLENYNFKGKTIIPFATSGGSEIDNISEHLKKSCSPETVFKQGKRFTDYTAETLKNWVNSLNI